MTSLPATEAPTHHLLRPITQRKSLRLLVALLLVGLEIYLIACIFFAFRLTQPNRLRTSETPADAGIAFEEVRFPARDGVMLDGWFIPAPGSSRVLLMVHGMGACRSCGYFDDFALQMHTQGFNLLMIDLRAHGTSQGKHFTLGDHERRDVLGALDWLQARGFTQIGALGASMGAASVVGAAAHPEGDQRIKAIVLDSGFAELPPILAHNWKAFSIPDFFLPGTVLMARLIIGTDPAQVRPVADLPTIQAPIMLIASVRDDMIPVANFHALAAARPDAETWLVPDAGHTTIFEAHTSEYLARVATFFNTHLPESAPQP